MANVILVVNRGDYPPMGALYVADALTAAGYKVRLLHPEMADVDFVRFVLDDAPAWVGFSAHTYPGLDAMVRKARLVKTLDIPTVWGGNHVSCLPQQALDEPCVDYIITGDGERAVIEFKLNGPRQINGGHLNDELDLYQPAWHLVDLSRYLFPAAHSVRGGGNGTRSIFYYLMTSRGCPFSCAFCYNSRTPKPPWRAHSVEWVVKQVEFLKQRLDIDGVGFWDDFFLANRERAQEIIHYLKTHDIKFLCEARATDLDADLVQWLKAMGCLQIFVGAESGSDRVLDMINKRITVADIRQAVTMTGRYELPTRLSFIYGFPGETWEELDQTRALVDELEGYSHVSISGPKLYTPYPGTTLYTQALAYGFEPPDRLVGWSAIHRASPINHLPWLEQELKEHNKTMEDLHYVS